MATNGEIPVVDKEMAECDEEVVTMMDVLKEQQDFEDDANAVLGGSDEKECTYSQGYIKRQAIYACMTCCPDSKDDPSKRAGFCLACSLTCHENHDLVELYTKRNFRCDCGNPKFKSPCQFTPNKPELNDENVYNQNFIGLYCICNKPYDQESALDDEMIQCIVCEDWWHATHLDAVVPTSDQYSEMICRLCMEKNVFFHDYSDLAVNIDQSNDVDVVNANPVDNNINETDDKLTNEKMVNGSVTDNKLTNGIEETSASNDMETSTTEEPNEDAPTGDNKDDASSMDKGVEESEKSEIETVEPEKPLETSEENKSTDTAMDTDEIGKATTVLTEVSSEDKPDTTSEDKTETTSVNNTEGNEATSEDVKKEQATEEEKTIEISTTSEDVKEEQATEEEKTIELSTTSEEKIEECGEAKKIEDSSAELVNKTADATGETAENSESSESEDLSEPPKQNDESTVETDSKTPNEKNASEVIEKLYENMETVENNITEYQDTDTDANKVDYEKAKIDSPSAETNENTPDQAKLTEISQDQEMNDINKETENNIVPEDSSLIEISKNDEAVNIDSKETDSTNKIESESNENIVTELASTENKRKMLTEDVTDDIISTKKPKLNEIECVKPKGVKKVYKGATFWPLSFRQKLCKCNECITMYKDLSVLFITDLEDTIFAYETLGKERTAGKPNQYEKGMEALCSLGRIQQIDALTEYNKMKDKLLTFLQSFKDKKEIVTEHDIKTFFAGMKPEKRMDGVYFCR